MLRKCTETDATSLDLNLQVCIATSGIYLARILRDAEADPKRLVGVRGWGVGYPFSVGRCLVRGLNLSPEIVFW